MVVRRSVTFAFRERRVSDAVATVLPPTTAAILTVDTIGRSSVCSFRGVVDPTSAIDQKSPIGSTPRYEPAIARSPPGETMPVRPARNAAVDFHRCPCASRVVAISVTVESDRRPESMIATGWSTSAFPGETSRTMRAVAPEPAAAQAHTATITAARQARLGPSASRNRRERTPAPVCPACPSNE